MQGFSKPARSAPLVLTVPGLGNSGPAHWQTLWEAQRTDTARVDLGMWDRPHRNSWISRLDQTIRASDAPVILVAHSLGCIAVAWWAALSPQAFGSPVAGALLLAPADVDGDPPHPLLAGFAPTPQRLLPFPSVMVASQNDPWIAIGRARSLAHGWGSGFVDAGHAGHINADSGLGAWRDGEVLLERLIDDALGGVPERRSVSHAFAPRRPQVLPGTGRGTIV